jgi:zinc transporter 5/7
MNPPELMAIDRLLWVSSVGLAINLFGMYATGGHHHHGHGHGHGHDHGHGYNHIAVNEKKVRLMRLRGSTVSDQI